MTTKNEGFAPALTGEPPRLPGTVWPREGEPLPEDGDGDRLCVTVDERDNAAAWIWTPAGEAAWPAGNGAWDAYPHGARDIPLTMWAMAERTRAEQAEADRDAAIREADRLRHGAPINAAADALRAAGGVP